MTWEAWAIFRAGQLLYDRFFFDKEQAYLYKLTSYKDVATEENPAGCWMMHHKITVEKVVIRKQEENGTNRINSGNNCEKEESKIR